MSYRSCLHYSRKFSVSFKLFTNKKVKIKTLTEKQAKDLNRHYTKDDVRTANKHKKPRISLIH